MAPRCSTSRSRRWWPERSCTRIAARLSHEPSSDALVIGVEVPLVVAGAFLVEGECHRAVLRVRAGRRVPWIRRRGRVGGVHLGDVEVSEEARRTGGVEPIEERIDVEAQAGVEVGIVAFEALRETKLPASDTTLNEARGGEAVCTQVLGDRRPRFVEHRDRLEVLMVGQPSTDVARKSGPVHGGVEGGEDGCQRGERPWRRTDRVRKPRGICAQGRRGGAKSAGACNRSSPGGQRAARRRE